MSFDLGWGNSVCVREAFLANTLGGSIQFDTDSLLKFDYPDHDGDPDLVAITREVIRRQIGREYKHVFLVNGATGGCVIAMRAYQQRGKKNVVTRKAPYYVRYPRMIQAAGLVHQEETKLQPDSVALVDLPSNPLGLMSTFARAGVPIILDGVYLNRIYMRGTIPVASHDVMVGSYSKLTGINGIRLGWIALDDDLLAARVAELVASEYCGLSTASTAILKHLVFGFQWDKFEQSAQWKLDMNREVFSELERFFQGATVPPIGMFFYGPMDKKAQEIFVKAGVTWTKGSAMGTDDSFARFNLGQNNDYLEWAVAAVLKADRIK